METITYKQAADLLQCSYQTIRIAVIEDRLTQFRTKKGPRLLKKQVELFIGKHAISDRFLNLQELAEWKECQKAAQNTLPLENRSEIESMLSSIETRQIMMEEKLVSLDKVNDIMEECISAIRELMYKTDNRLPKELEKEHPPLPLVHN